METTESASMMGFLPILKNFLKGMETARLIMCNAEDVSSKTSLKGWKHSYYKFNLDLILASKTSLKGWKRGVIRGNPSLAVASKTSLKGWKHYWRSSV